MQDRTFVPASKGYESSLSFRKYGFAFDNTYAGWPAYKNNIKKHIKYQDEPHLWLVLTTPLAELKAL